MSSKHLQNFLFLSVVISLICQSHAQFSAMYLLALRWIISHLYQYSSDFSDSVKELFANISAALSNATSSAGNATVNAQFNEVYFYFCLKKFETHNVKRFKQQMHWIILTWPMFVQAVKVLLVSLKASEIHLVIILLCALKLFLFI